MELVEAFQPNIFEALCDTATSLECKHKRIKKSVDRTLQFLDKSLEIKELNEVSVYVHMGTLHDTTSFI